ncbi:unnamed protein product [Fraxinus pennsylvanica]|uniref:Uncharacterized protein n=1 Tax=Fraxinus pennsylvanica TaxID=56036 RepID=A0AAD1Z2B3_9LAMI|nr:unnamed protein product [Fraxinus pennsylvanica]
MASGLLPFRPLAIVRASISADDRKPDAKKTSSSHWWAPLFGVSSEPDYLQSDDKKTNHLDPIQPRSRFTPGSFTEEKAKQLRRMTTDTSSHDMYHSAIASRLASDFTDRRTS